MEPASAPVNALSAASRLASGVEASRVPAAAAPTNALDGTWTRIFDGTRNIKEEVSAAFAGAASIGDAPRLSPAPLTRAAVGPGLAAVALIYWISGQLD
jgi:hypothetical protein